LLIAEFMTCIFKKCQLSALVQCYVPFCTVKRIVGDDDAQETELLF
jgi:hypothetical protein